MNYSAKLEKPAPRTFRVNSLTGRGRSAGKLKRLRSTAMPGRSPMFKCPSCSTDLEQVEATVRLDDRHHLLFCPFCGENLGNHKSERIFFDDNVRQYRYWVQTHPDLTVTVEETRGKFRFVVTAHVL